GAALDRSGTSRSRGRAAATGTARRAAPIPRAMVARHAAPPPPPLDVAVRRGRSSAALVGYGGRGRAAHTGRKGGTGGTGRAGPGGRAGRAIRRLGEPHAGHGLRRRGSAAS